VGSFDGIAQVLPVSSPTSPAISRSARTPGASSRNRAGPAYHRYTFWGAIDGRQLVNSRLIVLSAAPGRTWHDRIILFSATDPAQIFVESFLTALAAEPALTIAAKAGRGVEQIGAIDPDGASFDLSSDVQRQIDILTPDTGGKPIGGVIGQRHRFRWGAEGHGDQNGAEDLDLCDGRRRRDVGE
jgi:hypothetical protein